MELKAPPLRTNANALLLRGTLTPQHLWFGVRVHPEGIYPEGHPEPTLTDLCFGAIYENT